ncbi:phosphoenolpyruvate hydrolase family protein [Sphingomonas colocasiae]|uniref:Phosphoenolpyruvate hydrolase family protein n=1 Tax=Sphingomonas colocasiae TaxID=1848973 RepID=A0ABS7PHG9_9SPHN|nr:phosphoenolpyruvate hydrolase family protein [Sphingomonas colocasiae]MBY8820747.1 phosphoenolpyruvate hydrolase family protein [Sphingomonas colocasiae]
MRWKRQEILGRFREKIAAGMPIVGSGAGTGISAKCAEQGGADLLIIYNSGRFRMAGRGSLSGLLAYGNANEIVLDMGKEVLSIVEHTPVLAGVNGTDPFLLTDRFLREITEMGFAGVQNFPTVGLIDGSFRLSLEETGMSYSKEIDLIAAANAADLLTTPYVFDTEQAKQMTRAGADIIVAHMGLTTGGQIGAKTAMSLDAAANLVNEIIDASRSERSDVIVLCHGGPISSPEDVQVVLGRCPNVDGFYGATSMERLPAEIAITEQVRKFASLPLQRKS